MPYKSCLVKFSRLLALLLAMFQVRQKHAFWSERQSSLYEISCYKAFITDCTLCNQAFIIIKENHKDISCDSSRNQGFYGATITYSRLQYAYYCQSREREFHFSAACDELSTAKKSKWSFNFLRAGLAPHSKVFITDCGKP